MNLEKNPFSSKIDHENKYFFEIVDMGPEITSSIMKKYKDGLNVLVFLPAILKNKFISKFDQERKVHIFEDYPDYVYAPPGFHPEKNVNKADSIWLYWWDEGRKLTPELFTKKYAAYEEAKKSGNEEQIKDTYTKLQDMGVIILPDLLKRIKAGDSDVIPMFSYLSNEKVSVDASSDDCEKWWNENKSQYAEILNY